MQARPSIKAVVLAGAQDWGHCPLRAATPRPLAPIANQPLLMHSFTALRRAGITDVVLCANGDTRAFRRVFGDGESLGISLLYSEDQMPRGPAGCVKDASEFGSGAEVLVLEGGLVPDIDFGKLIGEHRQSGALVTVAVDGPEGLSDETSGIGPQPMGLYVFGPKATDFISATGYQDIKEGLLPRLYEAGEHVTVTSVDGSAPRVMGPESYLRINSWLVERVIDTDRSFPGYSRLGESLIHETARVSPTARLVGPVMIGPHTTLGHETVILGPSSIGGSCEVGDGSIISRSAVWEGARIGRNCQVEQSILAYGSRAGSDSQVVHTVLLGRRLRPSERTTLSARYELGAAAGR